MSEIDEEYYEDYYEDDCDPWCHICYPEQDDEEDEE